MRARILAAALLAASAILFAPARAAELAAPDAAQPITTGAEAATDPGSRIGGRVQRMIDDALQLVGIRYRRGGGDVETGFDCSGFVRYVFQEALGVSLPRTSRELSREGDPVERSELKPGDLVFFNTMRRAFSHVGIYLGDDRFIHSPRPGRSIRVEDMTSGYWAKRYNGARRVEQR